MVMLNPISLFSLILCYQHQPAGQSHLHLQPVLLLLTLSMVDNSFLQTVRMPHGWWQRD
jgi:cell shape-determining protein MreD